MYVYVRSEPGLWTVGFYKPDGAWEAESDHGSTDEAAARVHYLNGGKSEDEGGGSWEEYQQFRRRSPNPQTRGNSEGI